MTGIKTLFIMFVLCVLPPTLVRAQAPPVDACDTLAAHPGDVRAVAKGVSWDNLKGHKAVAACQRALETHPGTARFQYQMGRAMNKLGRYGEAAAWHLKAAEQAYAPAQYSLGLMYGDGDGVPKDTEKMVEWYRKSAEQGFAAAQYYLGIMYHNGEVVPQDYQKAAMWLRKSAEQGDADAQYQLGLMHRLGRGIPQNHLQAIAWLRPAAEHGIVDAQFHVGVMYYNGEGEPKDRAKAVSWFLKAAAQDHHEAANSVAWIMATTRNKPLRNGADAVRLAKKALALHEDDAYHDTLAAAYVANGQPREAIVQYTHVMKAGGRTMIKAFQDFMRKKGFYEGVVTGRNDEKTQTALAACVHAGCQIGVD